MKAQLEAILKNATAEIKTVADRAALENVRVKFLGKKGELTAILRGMKDLSAEERPVIGQLANDVRAAIETAIEAASKGVEEASLNEMCIRDRTGTCCVRNRT